MQIAEKAGECQLVPQLLSLTLGQDSVIPQLFCMEICHISGILWTEKMIYPSKDAILEYKHILFY